MTAFNDNVARFCDARIRTEYNHLVCTRKVQTSTSGKGRDEKDEDVWVLMKFVDHRHAICLFRRPVKLDISQICAFMNCLVNSEEVKRTLRTEMKLQHLQEFDRLREDEHFV